MLVDLYQKKSCALKTVEIVNALNHGTMGTVRNLMQTLKVLGLVGSIAGPRGGYIPTERAYEALGFASEAESIPIYRNEILSEATLREMRIKPPNISIFHVLGDIKSFNIGDRIKVASNKLIISGKVEGRNDLNNCLISSIEIAFLRG